jgi:hypothetical protein
MPIIDTPAGTLEVTNAILSASEFRATQKISVSNSAPTKNFSVGDKFHVSTTDADAVNITGNLVAQTLKIGNLLVSPTFDLAAVSNVGNTTSNTLQFANATTSFVASSNVEIGGNITLTSNAQVKVGSNVLAEYTGPHGREPKEMPLKKFPEIAFEEGKFDRNDAGNTFIQAGYTITGGGTDAVSLEYPVRLAFNGKTIGTGDAWHSEDDYNSTTGAYSGPKTTTESSNTWTGDYIELKIPKLVKMSHLVMFVQPMTGTTDSWETRFPKEFVVLGSQNGTTWSLIKTVTDIPIAAQQNVGSYLQLDASAYYKYFRIVVSKNRGNTYTSIGELEYYGYEEPAPPGDLSLDTTLKSTFNSVRSNNYVMYFDGKDPAAGNVPKNLVNDSSISITPHNAVFDTTNNCWTLDGSTESNVTTGSLGFEGDVPHTVSTWINASNLEANALTQQLFSIGSGYDKAFLKVDDTQIAANTWHNVTYAYQGEGGSKVTYVDGRKVEEAQAEDTFGVYPRFGMTGYKTGGYCVSASSEYENSNEYPAWQAFDHDTTTNGNQWICATGLYENNGTYTGTTSTVESSNTWTGEYLQLELPYKIRVSDVQILREINVTYGTSRSPNTGAILGSNDGYNWSYILNFTNKPHTDYTDTVFSSLGTSSGTDSYKYLRLVVTKIQDESVTSNSNGNLISICEIRYYGHKEGDLTRFPEPTRVLKYPHILTKNGTGDGFTSATSAPEYGKRGYVIKASSSIASYPPYAAFNGETHVATGTTWIGGFNSYGTNNSGVSVDGGYKTVGTMNLKTNLGTGGSATSDGEWLYIEMPSKITVTSTNIISNDGAGYPPDYVVIYGTNDPSSSGGWNVVDNTYVSSSSGIPNSADGKTWTVSTASNPVAYKYFALVIVKVNSTAGYSHAVITEWKLYGTQEDTETPLIVGGPFAGKVANFRVYDQYLGDERIQEIYDAQKDAFGHKKSSMTFYKGRIGVGTTEPEGALTVIDEPHALAKFPARAISADDSYDEGIGHIKLSSAESSGGYAGAYGSSGSSGGSGFNAFDGLTSTCWSSTPTRNTRVSEEVDFGAWLKIQTPESVSLKKAEIESKPDLRQVGSDINGNATDDQLGRAVACSHDGTRIIAGGHVHSGNQGMVRVYDWNGTTWELIGNQTITGTADNDKFGSYVAISGDGNIIAVAAPFEHANGDADKGVVRVYYLVGSTWTILPDSGSLTETETGFVDAFVGSAVNGYLGGGGIHLSYDGRTLLITEPNDDSAGTDRGQVRIFTYDNGEWSQKGDSINGTVNSEKFGSGSSMSEDGNHIVVGTSGDITSAKVKIYKWNGTNAWVQKGSDLTYTGNDQFGPVVSISNDGNTVAVGIRDADIADGALVDTGGLVHVYHWSGSAWGTPHKLKYNEAVNEQFGSAVKLSGDGKILIVGAGGENTFSGELFMYKYTGSSWINLQNVDGGTLGHLGYGPGTGLSDSITISKDGSMIIGGELGYMTGTNIVNTGRIRVFSMPSNIKSIWGSNDDVNWTKITTAPTREEATSNVAGLAFGYDDRLEFKNLDNPNYYKYHAIVADAFTQLKDVKLFGVRNQGSSTLHDGTLTLTKNLDVPRIGPPLDADDTPRRDRLVVEYNTSTNPVEDGVVRDTSGWGNDGILRGSSASYEAGEKSLRVTTAGDAIESMKLNNPGGAYAHSFSLWFKTGGTVNRTICVLGNDTGNDSHGIFFGSTRKINQYHYGNDKTYDQVIESGRWYHVVATYDGGSVATSRRLWLNGTELTSYTITGTLGAPVIPANTTLYVCSRKTITDVFDGSVSNFKLYDTTLTAEEVKTLYDMGRCSNAIPKTLHIMGGMMRYNNDINRLQIHNGVGWSTIGGVSASGGTVSYVGDYTVHTFTSSGTFTLYSGGEIEYLIVAGGGAGGSGYQGGGGGAGGLRTGSIVKTPGSYTVTIGLGGAGGASGGSTPAASGNSSSAIGIACSGGGRGAGEGPGGGAAASGGSGGGGSHGIGTVAGGAGIAAEGNNGGSGYEPVQGGGGGGAGEVGESASSGHPGDGGDGLFVFGAYYAGGGGGTGRNSTNFTSRGLGGKGGGGNGLNGGRDGTPNTGGGGGASTYLGASGSGGSGIVIIRYL